MVEVARLSQSPSHQVTKICIDASDNTAAQVQTSPEEGSVSGKDKDGGRVKDTTPTVPAAAVAAAAGTVGVVPAPSAASSSGSGA